MAIPCPLSLRKTSQILPSMEKLPASVCILLAPTSVNQQTKQCLAKGLLCYLASCDLNKDFLLKSCWANWRTQKIETHLCVCPGIQSWLEYNHNHNHINTTCHLRVHLCSTLPLHLTGHVGRMLGRRLLTEAPASLLKRALVQGNIAGFLVVGSEQRLFLRDEKIQL